MDNTAPFEPGRVDPAKAAEAIGGMFAHAPTFALPGVQSGGPMHLLFAAKAAARKGFRAIARTRTVKVRTRDGGTYEFAYAPLDEVLDATMPALSANGLELTWLPVSEDSDGSARLICLLTHESGAYMATSMRLPPANGPQDRGSQITYGRRYQAQCVLGVASEEDDDGNLAAGNEAKVEERPRREQPRRDPPGQRQPSQPRQERALEPERQAKTPEQSSDQRKQPEPEQRRQPSEPPPREPEDPGPAMEPPRHPDDVPPRQPSVIPDDMDDQRVRVALRETAVKLGMGRMALNKECQAITGKAIEELTRADMETLLAKLRLRVTS